MTYTHITYTQYDRVYAVRTKKYPVLAKNRDILGWWNNAYCKLAPTLARQMWRHNYVIDRNEYIISALSESTFPWVYSLQFLFTSTHHSWRYVFFLNTVYNRYLQDLRAYRGFGDLAIEWRRTNSTTSDPCYHGNNIWDKIVWTRNITQILAGDENGITWRKMWVHQ